MLVAGSRLENVPILSVQAGGVVAETGKAIIDPENLKIIGFFVKGGVVGREEKVLSVSSIREYSRAGMVVDSADEFMGREEIVKIAKVLELNFSLVGLKVETKKGSQLGKIADFTVASEDFLVQQIIVRRPALKALIDPELTISRKEIVEVTDDKIVVKDEEQVLKKKAETEDFIPNFVNPFRKSDLLDSNKKLL